MPLLANAGLWCMASLRRPNRVARRPPGGKAAPGSTIGTVSYTHLRAHGHRAGALTHRGGADGHGTAGGRTGAAVHAAAGGKLDSLPIGHTSGAVIPIGSILPSRCRRFRAVVRSFMTEMNSVFTLIGGAPRGPGAPRRLKDTVGKRYVLVHGDLAATRARRLDRPGAKQPRAPPSGSPCGTAAPSHTRQLASARYSFGHRKSLSP